MQEEFSGSGSIRGRNEQTTLGVRIHVCTDRQAAHFEQLRKLSWVVWVKKITNFVGRYLTFAASGKKCKCIILEYILL